MQRFFEEFNTKETASYVRQSTVALDDMTVQDTTVSCASVSCRCRRTIADGEVASVWQVIRPSPEAKRGTCGSFV